MKKDQGKANFGPSVRSLFFDNFVVLTFVYTQFHNEVLVGGISCEEKT